MADIEQRLKFILDRSEQRRTEQGIREIRDGVDDAAKGTRKAASNADVLADEIANAGNEARKLNDQLDRVEKPRRVQVDTSRFDETSRNVSLAGDAESNLRAVSGAIGFAGGTGLERGLNVGAELFAVTEALPRLKEAAAGLPATFGAAAAALGPAGLVVAGVAAGAAAIAALYKFSIREQEEALKNFAEASKSFVDFAAGGGTAEQALEQQQENLRRIEIIEAEKLRLELEYAERRFNFLDRLLNGGEQALVDTIKDFDDEIKTLGAENERFTEAIENNELATNDATAAQERATQETQSAAQAFDNATRGLSSQTSATRELENAASDFANNAQKTADTLRDFRPAQTATFGTFDIGALLGLPSPEEVKQEADSRIDDLNRINEARAEAINARNQALVDSENNLARRVEDLALSQSRAFEDAFETGSVLGLRDATKNIRRQREDAEIDAQRRELDIQQDYAQRRLELQRQYEQLVTSSVQNLVTAATVLSRATSGIVPGRQSSNTRTGNRQSSSLRNLARTR